MIIPKPIEQYIKNHSSEIHPLLNELERETHLKFIMPQMLSGKEQGVFLKMLVELSGSKHILEIGTFTGYAALCMAYGLPNSGSITAIEVNPEVQDIIEKYFSKSGLQDKLNLIIGNAESIIPELDEVFDLVFIDADKQNYSNYFDLLFQKVKLGGLIIADNVLWNGRVVEPNPKIDTQAILDFNTKIQNDPRVENVLIGMRDGLMVMRKISE